MVMEAVHTANTIINEKRGMVTAAPNSEIVATQKVKQILLYTNITILVNFINSSLEINFSLMGKLRIIQTKLNLHK